jgi:hypothetical protein
MTSETLILLTGLINGRWWFHPREEDAALWINQDARFSLTKLTAGEIITVSTMHFTEMACFW